MKRVRPVRLVRRSYFRHSFARNASGCSRAYRRSLHRRTPQRSRSLRPANCVPHSTHCRCAGVTRRRSLCSGCSARHCRVRSIQHARHQLFHPLFSFRFGRNAENGRNSLHRLQCRPFGGYRITNRTTPPARLLRYESFSRRVSGMSLVHPRSRPACTPGCLVSRFLLCAASGRDALAETAVDLSPSTSSSYGHFANAVIAVGGVTVPPAAPRRFGLGTSPPKGAGLMTRMCHSTVRRLV
jgi:hypothetical protein